MLGTLRSKLVTAALPRAVRERIDAAVRGRNSAGFDPWGLDAASLKEMVAATRWLYTDYFRVETRAIENVPEGRVMVVANHSGQLPFDALLVILSLLLDAKYPRIGRSMVDHWVPSLPFIGSHFTRLGNLVGSPQNCIDLLNDDQCVVVFPEGTRGLGKPFSKRYQLQGFGTGFLRLALAAKAPILPVAVIGAEEIYPGIADMTKLANALGFPYFPVTPFFPLFGPLGAVPLPCKITLRYAEPIPMDGDPDMPDHELQHLLQRVTGAIEAEITAGLEARGGDLFFGSAVGKSHG